MSRVPRLLALSSLVVLWTAVLAPDASAYIDPGNGSYVFQLVIAGTVGLLYTVKMFWRRIRESATDVVRRIRKHGNEG